MRDGAAGGSGFLTGMAEAVVDQLLSPAELTARTCTSYWLPLVRPVMSPVRAPVLQTLGITVQLASVLSWALVRMRRRS